MKTNPYSLQLLHHAECFATREEAIQYVNEEFKNKALMAEPSLVFYGNAAEPNAILVFGTVDRKVFMIDTARMDESIDSLIETTDTNVANIEVLQVALKEVVKSCGLVWDENKISDQISYVPDSRDTLLVNCENLSAAIDVISKYVQEQFKANKISLANTKSISLKFTDNEEGGKTLNASVNLSTDGDNDEIYFNDNILGVKNDGLFAAAHLAYDEERHQLIFTTSGLRNGSFVDDAKKQIINLGEHRQYDAVNGGHNITIVTDKVNNTISADVKISEDENNILVEQDGKLLVDGRAANIKYKGKTVFKGLNELENSVSSIQSEIEKINDTHFIEGTETDTMTLVAEKLPLGNHRITGNVKLGTNNSIKVMNGGLEAIVDVATDPIRGKLTFTCGNTVKELDLPGISLVEKIYYDSDTKNIVIVVSGGTTIEVPITDLLKEWIVNNPETSPIVLNKNTATASNVPDVLSADIRLADENNLLQVVDGKLLAKESKITDAVEAEKARAMEAENGLGERITAHETAVAEKFETVDNRIAANVTAITAEETRAMAAEAELSNGIETLGNSLSDVTGRVGIAEADILNIERRLHTAEDAVAENTNDIASNLAAINTNADNIDALTGRVTVNEEKVTQHNLVVAEQIGNLASKDNELASQINTVSEKLTIEVNRATEKEGALLDKINEVASNLADEATNRQTQDTAIVGQITAISEAVNKLNEGEDTPGSVVNIVSHAVNDVMGVLNNEIANRENADTTLNEKVDTLKTNVEASIANTADDTKAYTDNEVSKLKVNLEHQIENAEESAVDTASADATAKADAALADAKAYTDVEKERAMTAEGGLASDIAALQTKDGEIEASLANKIETVTIEKNSVSDLQYTLLVNGQPSGEINIPKDQFLKDVTYDSVSKKLNFVFVTSTGETSTEINIADLVDTYEAGNGISMTDNTFTVQICEGSEAYLTVGTDGLKLTGINDALDLKADKTSVYSKEEADNKFLVDHQDISNLATKEEVGNVDTKVVALTSVVDEHTAQIAIINGNEAEEGSIANAIKTANDNAGALVEAEKTRAEGVESDFAAQLAIINGNESQDGSIKNALEISKDYTDSKMIEAAAALNAAKIEINTQLAAKANAADVYSKFDIDAKGYLVANDIADLATKAEVATINAQVNENTTAITKINAGVETEGSLSNTLAKAKEYTNTVIEPINNKVEVLIGNESTEGSVKNAIVKANEYTNEKIGEVNTELANKVESVEIVKNSASDLQYILKVDGVDVSEINIPKDQFLKDVVYDSGNKQIVFDFETSSGVTQTTVDVSDLVDTYNSGQGISLVDNVFSIKVNEDSEAYLKLTDEGLAIMGINDALAKKANVNDVYAKSEVDSFNEGLGNRIDNVVSEVVTVNSAITEHSELLDKLDGNEAVTGSVSNAIKVSKEYTDAQINTVNDALSDKVNVGDSYTKSEIDNMGFLTEHQDISYLAEKTEVNDVKVKVDAVEVKTDSAITKNVEQDANISAVEAELVRQNLKVEDTNTVGMTVSKSDNGTTLSANVKVKSSGVNIIKSDSEGIFANVTLGYNAATNTITFNNGNGDDYSFILSEHTLVEDGFYESATQKIVLIVRNSDGLSKRIEIPVGDLVNTFEINNPSNSPVKLTKQTVDGIEYLSAELAVASDSHNAVITNGGNIFVSNLAQDMFATYGTYGVITVQDAIENLKESVDKFETIVDDVKELKTDVNEAKAEITSIGNEFNSVKNGFTNLSQQVSALDVKVSAYDTRINNLEVAVNEIKNAIGAMDSAKPSIMNRLDAIETALNNLIDFGTYE